MEITISKEEIEELIDEAHDEGDITEEEKEKALNDLKLGDYNIWVENDGMNTRLDVDFEFAGVNVSKWVGELDYKVV